MGKSLIKNPGKVLPQLIVAVWGSWGYFSMGSVRGWSSPGIPSLNRTVDFEVYPSDFQWISSFPMIGAVLGSLFINKPMQHFGRKKALIGHYFIFISGFLITGFTYFGKHKSMLYVGRFLMGFAAGCTTPACQIYVSECASPRIRGRLGSLTASSLALGILVTYIIGAFVDWYVLAWILGGLPMLFLCGTFTMPESPVWLLSNGREHEARRSLQLLRGKDTNVEAEMGRIKEHQERIANNSNHNKSITRLFRDVVTAGPVVKPLGISLGVMLFQQTTGINAIIFYTVSIFQTAGSTIDSRYATIIVGAVQLVFTVASGFLVDRCGRRMLFISSAVATSVPLAAMGIFFYFQRQWGDKEATRSLGWLPIVCLIVFFVTYSGGMSNVPFIIMGEMFPTEYRALLGAISSSFHLFCTFVAVFFFPNMLKAMGKDGTFFFYAGCTLLSAFFVYFLLPETKGKTLEEIELIFSSNRHQHVKSIYRLDDVIATGINMNGDVIFLRRSQSNDSDSSELQLCVDKLENTRDVCRTFKTVAGGQLVRYEMRTCWFQFRVDHPRIGAGRALGQMDSSVEIVRILFRRKPPQQVAPDTLRRRSRRCLRRFQSHSASFQQHQQQLRQAGRGESQSRHFEQETREDVPTDPPVAAGNDYARHGPINPFSSSDQLLRTHLEELFHNGTLSDVTLDVGGRRFGAHKVVLASRSKVFAAMFVHETAEKLSNHVDIPDVHPDVFQEVLRFIYTGRVPLEKLTAALLAAADKYLLEQLKLECETQLIHRMSAENCLELLALADPHHPAQHLKKFAVDFFRRFPCEVMATDGWKRANDENAAWLKELEQRLPTH